MAAASEEPPPSSPPLQMPPLSSAEETLSLFTTLLGTFQLKEEEEEEEEEVHDVEKHRDNQKCESAAPTTAARTPPLLPRNGRLLQVLLASTNKDDSEERSSFSCLSLDHPHGEHNNNTSTTTSTTKSNTQTKKNQPPSTLAPSHIMDKDQAEELAASLMGREIYATAKPSSSSPSTTTNKEEGDDETISSSSDAPLLPISQIPQTLLQHFYESFSVLVDARLRAYASFLTQFGHSLEQEEHADPTAVANIARKLEILMWLGSHISVDAVVTSFAADASRLDDDDDEDEEEEMKQLDHNHMEPEQTENCRRRRVTLPISLEGVLDLTIPHFHFGVRNTSVTICATGTISGDFDLADSKTTSHTSNPVLRAVHLHLNTHELLAAMMEEASHIVSVVVDMTNDACHAAAAVAISSTSSTGSITSKVSKLMFPKLPSQNNNKRTRSSSADEGGETLVENKQKKLIVSLPPRHTIVTPDLSGYSIGKRVPSFTLDDHHHQQAANDGNQHQEETLDTSRFTTSTPTNSEDCPLTPERCANIVDFAICDIDDTILAGRPMAKRPRFGMV